MYPWNSTFYFMEPSDHNSRHFFEANSVIRRFMVAEFAKSVSENRPNMIWSTYGPFREDWACNSRGLRIGFLTRKKLKSDLIESFMLNQLWRCSLLYFRNANVFLFAVDIFWSRNHFFVLEIQLNADAVIYTTAQNLDIW